MWEAIRDRALAIVRVEYSPVSHTEKLVSGLGGFLGIFLIIWITNYYIGGLGAPLIVASMGASSVLVFGVPHGQLSQPWAVFGGHVISCLVGVTCAQHIPDSMVAAALAVGLSITAMHYLRCLHPPGGATALTTVVGGTQVHELGYQFVLTPLLLNVLVIIATAVAVNYFFPWRRYPVGLMKSEEEPPPVEEQGSAPEAEALSHQDLAYAMKQLDAVIDVAEADLNRIYALAVAHSHRSHMDPEEIRLGRYYSNGEYGANWSVRQVVDESTSTDPGYDLVVYKVVAGKDRRKAEAISRDDFARWAKYEVYLNENSWLRVSREDDNGD